ncbi:outer membrane protein assembly factor BamD [Desulforhopalus singaporensis]|nr:outer membrane protein assembly factor BamD [Desulforhopalus singaporensis]
MILVILLLAMQSGCSGFKETFNFTSIDEEGNVIENDNLTLPARKLLSQGMDDYNVGKYFTAVQFFEEILNRYPFSPEAILAELKAADCSYHLGKYLEALMLYEEFEERHPTNASMPYVLYQKAMCNYKRIDRIDRDPSGAEQAIRHFNQLLKAYPDSPYSAEAEARTKAATEFLANHEYFVVEYYVRTAKYDQAAVRLNYLLAAYPKSSIAPTATELLARIEAGDPPGSKLSSWFPKLNLPDWTLFGGKDEEDDSVGPVVH